MESNKIAAYGLFGTILSAFIIGIFEAAISPGMAEALYTLDGLAFIIFGISAGILLLKHK